MLFCGHGCGYAVDEVMQLAAKLKSPLGYSFRGKIFFERKGNPFAVGLIFNTFNLQYLYTNVSIIIIIL